MRTYKVHISEVEWDLDEPNPILPTKDFMIIFDAPKISDDGHEVSDALTDQYDTLVNYAVYEIVRVI